MRPGSPFCVAGTFQAVANEAVRPTDCQQISSSPSTLCKAARAGTPVAFAYDPARCQRRKPGAA
jgi:hypothetical protein